MATVYISPTGSDAYTYAQAQSSSTPWQTISKCNTSATTGDTIICLNGTYTWVSQTFTKAFTIQAQTNGSVIFDGAGAYVTWAFSTYGGALTGLKFQNNVSVPTASSNNLFSTSENLTVTNCVFTNLVCNSGDNNVTNGGLFIFGISVTSKTITLTNCLIYAVNNDRTYAGAQAKGGLFHARTANNWVLNNCTIYLAPDSTNHAFQAVFLGYQAATGVSTLNMKNCIISNASSETTLFENAVTGDCLTQTVSYSDAYQITTPPTGTGVITSNPLFVDAANANFNLRPSSPCIDTGTIL